MLNKIILLAAVLLGGCATTSYPPREPCAGKGGIYSSGEEVPRKGHSSFVCQDGTSEYIIRMK